MTGPDRENTEGVVPCVEYLQLIQAVIDRMGRNSFAVKGWSVAIVSGVLSLAVTQSKPTIALIAVYALVAMAGLDAYYLAIERSYIALYNEARTKAADWSLTAHRPTAKAVLRAVASPAVWGLHLFALAAAIVVLVTV